MRIILHSSLNVRKYSATLRHPGCEQGEHVRDLMFPRSRTLSLSKLASSPKQAKFRDDVRTLSLSKLASSPKQAKFRDDVRTLSLSKLASSPKQAKFRDDVRTLSLSKLAGSPKQAKFRDDADRGNYGLRYHQLMKQKITQHNSSHFEVRRVYKYSLFYAILFHLLLLGFLFTKFANHHHYSVVDKSSVKIINAVVVNGQQVERKLQQIKVAKRKKLQAKLAHIHYLHEQALAAQHKKVLMQQRAAQIKAEHLRKLRVQRLRAEQLNRLKVARAKALVVAKQNAAIHHSRHTALDEGSSISRSRTLILSKLASSLRHAKFRDDAKQLRKQRELARRTALQQAMQQQLIQEHSQMLAAQAARMQAIIDRYKALIVQAISQYWVVPSNLAHGVSCQLLLNLVPGGTVLSVVVATSSGNVTLDRSAQTAVWKASPLPVPKDPAVFANFRAIKLTVRPGVS